MELHNQATAHGKIVAAIVRSVLSLNGRERALWPASTSSKRNNKILSTVPSIRIGIPLRMQASPWNVRWRRERSFACYVRHWRIRSRRRRTRCDRRRPRGAIGSTCTSLVESLDQVHVFIPRPTFQALAPACLNGIPIPIEGTGGHFWTLL